MQFFEIANTSATDSGFVAQFRRCPIGVVLCVGPFNYPFNETYTTLIPALVMGNTVVMKMPRTGVLCHWPTLPLFRDCFPPGVVNIISGSGRTQVCSNSVHHALLANGIHATPLVTPFTARADHEERPHRRLLSHRHHERCQRSAGRPPPPAPSPCLSRPRGQEPRVHTPGCQPFHYRCRDKGR